MSNNKLDILRLKRLKKIIKEIPAEKIDMNQENWLNKCKTKGCIMGWAALDPYFQFLGLEIDDEGIKCLDKEGADAVEFIFNISRQTFFDIFGLNSSSKKKDVLSRLNSLIEEKESMLV